MSNRVLNEEGKGIDQVSSLKVKKSILVIKMEMAMRSNFSPNQYRANNPKVPNSATAII